MTAGGSGGAEGQYFSVAASKRLEDPAADRQHLNRFTPHQSREGQRDGVTVLNVTQPCNASRVNGPTNVLAPPGCAAREINTQGVQTRKNGLSVFTRTVEAGAGADRVCVRVREKERVRKNHHIS